MLIVAVDSDQPRFREPLALFTRHSEKRQPRRFVSSQMRYVSYGEFVINLRNARRTRAESATSPTVGFLTRGLIAGERVTPHLEYHGFTEAKLRNADNSLIARRQRTRDASVKIGSFRRDMYN